MMEEVVELVVVVMILITYQDHLVVVVSMTCLHLNYWTTKKRMRKKRIYFS